MDAVREAFRNARRLRKKARSPSFRRRKGFRPPQYATDQRASPSFTPLVSARKKSGQENSAPSAAEGKPAERTVAHAVRGAAAKRRIALEKNLFPQFGCISGESFTRVHLALNARSG